MASDRGAKTAEIVLAASGAPALPSALAIVALPCPGPCQGRPQVGVRRQVARFAADLVKALLDLEGGQLAGSDQRLQDLRQVEGGPRGKRGEGTGCEDAHPV